jgi:hypothetical protein
MGQFSVEKPVAPGSVLSGNQHALLQRFLKASSRPRVIVFDVNGEYAPAFSPWRDKVRRTVLGQATKAERDDGVADFLIPYYALGRHGLARLLLPSERTQMPPLRFAVEHLRFVSADERGARANGNPTNALFDDCRTSGAQQAYTQVESIRSRNTPIAEVWPHMRALSCLAAESYSLKMGRNGVPERDAFSYGHIHSLINRCRSLIDDERFRSRRDFCWN